MEDVKDSDQASAVVAAEEVVVEKVEKVDGETAETGERRPKRRHSRRGRKKEPRDETKPAVLDKAAPEEANLVLAGPPAEDNRSRAEDRRGKRKPAKAEDEEVDDIMDEEGESEDDRPARQGFRGIPTWEEAVGLIITKTRNAIQAWRRWRRRQRITPAARRRSRPARETRRSWRRPRWTRRQTVIVTLRPAATIIL